MGFGKAILIPLLLIVLASIGFLAWNQLSEQLPGVQPVQELTETVEEIREETKKPTQTDETPEQTVKRDEAEESTIPIYRGSIEYKPLPFFAAMIGVPEGVDLSIYFVEDVDVSEVLKWYKDQFKNYELLEEISVVTISTPQGSAKWGALVFKINNEFLGIWAISSMDIEEGKGTVYYVAKGPIELFEDYESGVSVEELPMGDQDSGEEPIARYPGSVMLSYIGNINDRLEIGYGSKDSTEMIFRWYREYLESEGYTIIEEDTNQDTLVLKAESKEASVIIVIYPPNDIKNYAEFYVYYTVKKAPTPVEPVSDLGKEVDQFMKTLIKEALNEDTVLTSYTEFTQGPLVVIALEYTLQTSIKDISLVAQAIKNVLIDRGIPEPAIIIELQEESAMIIIIGGGKIAEKNIVTLEIRIEKGSSLIIINIGLE